MDKRYFNFKWVLLNGLVGAMAAGVIFAGSQMIISKLLSNQPLAPFKELASVALVSNPSLIPTNQAVIFGSVFHFAYSAVIGLLLAFFIAKSPSLRNFPSMAFVFCTLMGFSVWLFDFFVFAPIMGLTWFSKNTGLIPLAVHTVFFGGAFGTFFAARLKLAASH